MDKSEQDKKLLFVYQGNKVGGLTVCCLTV